jgi:ketosteroid isomerase-like protein
MPNRFCLPCILLGLILAICATNNAWSRGHSPNDESRIQAVLYAQVQAWNNGDIESFMNGYRKSAETTFVGASGIKKGWQTILENYRRRYPDRTAMGKLAFSNLEVHLVGRDAAYALGEFRLHRDKDDPFGYFSLYLRRFSEGWRIVLDHTTAGLPK